MSMISDDKRKTTDRPGMAGGIFLFLGLLIGAITGVALGEPSIGMVTGFAIGGTLALIVWLNDRRRGQKG
ncbi:MAG: hypothetical protein ACRCY3_05855 [Sphingorhabdus sp.]